MREAFEVPIRKLLRTKHVGPMWLGNAFHIGKTFPKDKKDNLTFVNGYSAPIKIEDRNAGGNVRVSEGFYANRFPRFDRPKVAEHSCAWLQFPF